jgi:hypothetical protein
MEALIALYDFTSTVLVKKNLKLYVDFRKDMNLVDV